MATKEQKSQVWHRVRREGRQDAFAARKAELEQEYLGGGKSNREAIALSWETAIAEFPALDESVNNGRHPFVADGSAATFDRAELATILAGKEHDQQQIMFWVWENIDNTELTIRDSIGFGSWSLLQWARSSRAGFYRLFFATVKEWPTSTDGTSSFKDKSLSVDELGL